MKKLNKFKEKKWLKDHYIDKNLSLREISELINVNIGTVARWIKRAGIDKKSQAQRASARRRTCIDRYGVENPFSSKAVQDKISKTNLKKYGNELSIKSDLVLTKIKKTNLERWGSEYYLGTEDSKVKREETMLKRYGGKTTMESSLLRGRAEETSLERYGTKHASKSDKVKEVIKDSLNKKYGSHHMRSKEFLKELSLSRDNMVIGNTSAYTYAKSMGFPTSNLHSLVSKSYSNEDIEAIISRWTNQTNLTDLEIIINSKIDYAKRYNKKVLSGHGYRPDFKLSDNIYLNVDGLYWHSRFKQSNNKYHFDMRKAYEDSGISLIQVRGDELLNSFNIVKSILNNKVGITSDKVYARKTLIKVVSHSDAKKFLKDNHLMGSIAARHLGLYHDNELSSVLSYKIRSRILKVERFCSRINTVVIGGFSKLLKYICGAESFDKICYWADLRYGTGNYLKKLGFVHKRDTLGWKWTDGRISTFNRLKCRANMDERRLTQKEYAKELGLVKIYDAGQRLWELNIS